MSGSRIELDLGQDLQHRIGDVVERQMAIAQHALSPSQLAMILVEASVSLVLTSCASAAAQVDDAAAQAKIYDVTLAAIIAGAQGDRQRSLDAVAARTRSAAA